MPDSERLYYSDSSLTGFTATVAELRETSRDGAGPAWQVSLDRSAFYPTSGGQPFDAGLLITRSPEGADLSVAVDQVEEDDDGRVWHFIGQPLAPGTAVEGRIDAQRRFDHMQQHTGQHLLSAVFARECNASTVSFHLGEQSSTIDLATGPLKHADIEHVERLANEIIAEDRPVATRFVTRDQAEAMLNAGQLRKLPEREGRIRLVEIAQLDDNACGGTHVRSTGQIGALLLRKIENVSRGIRVEFVCGLRAVRTARADAAVLNEAAVLLSVGAAELPAAVKRLQSDEKAGTKERQKLREELAVLQANSLVAEAPTENDLRLIVRDWQDKDRDYVRLLASRTAAAAPSTAVVFTAREADPPRIFLARSRDLPFHCGNILREALAAFGLRGGGSPDLAQGDVPAQDEPALRARLLEVIRDACPQ